MSSIEVASGPDLAQRIRRLGTETAFAVSAEAAAWAAKGQRVFPFHLGDLNLPTPGNIVEAAQRAIRDGKTGYCPPPGLPRLREALAADANKRRGTHYSAENVAVEPGGKPVIGKFLQTLMNPGDGVLYPNPGFPIYESQIEYLGGRLLPYTYREKEDRFALDLEAIERGAAAGARLLIFNDLQNPTGAEASSAELEQLAGIVQRHNLLVLCDEAYFEVRYSGQSRSLAALPGMEERCVLLYTFSKKYAMTGWRLGAAIGPKAIIDIIARLNVNDESCTNHFVQYAGIEALTGEESGPKQILETLRQRRDQAAALLAAVPGVRCFKPETTFYLYPNVAALMRQVGAADLEEFRLKCLRETGLSFCTSRHFGRGADGQEQCHIRIAYSGVSAADIEEGLGRLKALADRARPAGR